MNRIVVVEYPKSGGTWLVNLIADTLSLPKRDIYVKGGYKAFDIRRHPWYKDAQSLDLPAECVIKSHELPDSSLHNFSAKYVHLIRDGRDVIVSKYIYEKDFCVRNGIYKQFDIPFDDYVKKISIEWSHYVMSWIEKGVVICRYENLLGDPLRYIREVLIALNMNADATKIAESIAANTKEKMRESLAGSFEHNTFIRKGIAGDWKNHFNNRHKDIVKASAGSALILAGYERDLDW